MATRMGVEDRLEGSGNFRSWKHRLQMILGENDLLEHVTVGVPEPEGKESIKHMWERKRNLLPQRKLQQELRIIYFKLKIVDLKKDSKW